MITTTETNIDKILRHIENPLEENPSETGFLIGLYLEHLEEASFLYEQRISLLDDPELSWLDLDDFEQRFEAYIDALIVGEELALATCIQQAIEGDFGELHATVCVLCRWNNFTHFRHIIDNSDIEDKKRLKAIDDALCHEMPSEWVENLYTLCKGKNVAALYSILAHVIGYLRLKRSDIIYELLDAFDTTEITYRCAWSLGRIGSSQDKERLMQLFSKYTVAEIRKQAALALLRLKDTRIVQRLFDIKEPWAYILLGMSGTPQAQDSLIGSASSKSTQCPENILSIGLAGAVQGIDILVSAFDNKDLSEASSQALFCITGAELFEKVDIEENEVSPEESEQVDDGLPPENKVTIWQLSQDCKIWKEWLRENHENLPEVESLFLNVERTPQNLKKGLLSEKIPKNIRRYLCEMIAIMSPKNNMIEFDRLVSKQLILLNSH